MRAGAVLDRRYRIDARLAAGGFGAIYRATDLVMGREVALKVLHTELVDDPNVVERFRREAAALAMLRDPHTVTMYDLGEGEDGTLYIVMELLRGESLHDLFHAHGKRLPWRRVVKIARGVCSSLREAHSLGVVHRDLKPANIHLERHALGNDHVKVLDFGIAKLVGTSETYRELTLHGQMVGTFDYMSPEQLIGGLTTGKTDVFTLGVVIYEMIAGERPYGDARGPASMLMTLLGTTPVPLAQRATVPPDLDTIVMRAIQRDPEVRPDIFELDETFAAILDATVELDLARSATATAMAAARAESESDGAAESDAEDTDVGADAASDEDAVFDDADARFGNDDGPTWIEEARPLRRTPTNLRPTPNSLRPPAKRAGEGGSAQRGGSGQRPAAKLSGPSPTVIGTFAPVTPARGVPMVPLAPLASITPARGIGIAPSPPPTSPREFAVGSATQIPPVPTTAALAPLPTADGSSAMPPSRMPSGTTPIVNESRTADADPDAKPSAPLRVRFVSKPTIDPHLQRGSAGQGGNAGPRGPRAASPAELAAAIGGSAAPSAGADRDGVSFSGRGADRDGVSFSGSPVEVARIRRRDAILLAIAYIVLAALVAGGIYLMYGRG